MVGRFTTAEARIRDIPRVRRVALCVVGCFLIAGAGQIAAQQAPVIDNLSTSTSAVAPGGVVTITVEAHDPDCPDTCTTGCGLYIRSDITGWSATGGTFPSTNNGTDGSPYSASADWQAPATEGVYTISVYVADSGSFICGGRQSIRPTIDIQVTTAQNGPPVIDSLTANPTQLFQGQTSSLTCSATDPDDDPVTYSWQGDIGTVTPGIDGAATFTSETPGLATVTCRATDTGGLFGEDSIGVSVVSAVGDAAITSGLTAPLRLSIDASGNVFAVDRAGGSITVVDLFTGSLAYRLPVQDVTSIAVDWNDDLLVGSTAGARLIDRHGAAIPAVTFDGSLGEVSDVAVDVVNRRYGVLHKFAGRVVVYDEFGTQFAAFGSTGDATGQFRGPQGLAVSLTGQWLVADSGHGLIHVFDATGTPQTSFGGIGSGPGEFVRLDDVEVDTSGVIYASDNYQDWLKTFNPDGSPRETLGTYGDQVGEFQTATGIALAPAWDRVLAASTNSSSIQVFRTSDDPVVAPSPAVPAMQPNALGFEETAIGYESAAQSLTLSNSGEMLLGVQQVTMQGEFAQTNDCGGFVDPGQSCTFNVTFKPGAAGSREGTLAINTNGEPARVVASLSGTAFVPLPFVALNPSLLTFGDQEVGTVSDSLLVTLTNTGLATLEIASIDATPEYLQTSDCVSPLASGAACSIQVQFAPVAPADSVPGMLTITTSAAGSPHAVALDGRATPVVPLIAIDDVTVDEGDPGDTTEAIFTVTLSQTTTETVTVEFATVSDTAFAGEDFEDTSGTLTFLTGEVTQQIVVLVIGEEILETDEETFLVSLTNPIGSTFGIDTGIGTIVDDEPCVGPNLLVNASAEDRPDTTGVPGWTQVIGTTWQRRMAPPIPVNGAYYFFPGTTEYVELAQDVDVSAYADKIDTDQQWFRFEAWVHTLYEADPRTARLVVEYRDGLSSLVLDAFDTGEFSSPSIWQQLTDERPAPIGTRWIRVRLISTHLGDAYFDALSLNSLRAATIEVDDIAPFEGDIGIHRENIPVRLACPFHEPVSLDYLSSDETATEGEDYLAAVGTVSLEVGETVTEIPVDILGDVADEPHETFRVDVSLVQPSQAVLLDEFGVCTIWNDDYCPRTIGFWRDNPALWPVDWLEVGLVEYDKIELLALLNYAGSDLSHLLVAELIATRLNLAMGSEPSIRLDANEADAYLAVYPPGSNPQVTAKKDARDLRQVLYNYNAFPCDPPGGTSPAAGQARDMMQESGSERH